MMQYKGIKGQRSFFKKILERDLKLACLIPTQCTGKASCSYCTGPHQLRVRAGAVPKVLRWLPTCLLTQSLAILGWTCHHLTSIGFEHRQGNELTRWETDERLEPAVTPGVSCAWTLLPDPPSGLGCQDLLPLCHPHSNPSGNPFRMDCDVNVSFTRTCLLSFKNFIIMKFDS